MSNQFWNEDEDSDDFRDIPEDTKITPQFNPLNFPAQSAHAPRPQAPVAVQVQPEINYEEVESVELEEEEDYTSILSDARLRLEQGKLYEMIMNHDIFAGVDADEKAVKNVQREMRKFAKERMEVMLGMRQEKAETTVVSSPFNDLEVEILKKLAYRATNGATESSDANRVASTLKEAPKKQTLNSIGKPAAKPAPAPVAQKKLVAQPAAPVKRQNKAPVVMDGIAVPSEELEYKGIGKPVTELTEDERLQRNKEAAVRQAGRKAAKPTNALPMATPEQEYMIAQQSQMNLSNSPSVSRLVGVINALSKK